MIVKEHYIRKLKAGERVNFDELEARLFAVQSPYKKSSHDDNTLNEENEEEDENTEDEQYGWIRSAPVTRSSAKGVGKGAMKRSAIRIDDDDEEEQPKSKRGRPVKRSIILDDDEEDEDDPKAKKQKLDAKKVKGRKTGKSAIPDTEDKSSAVKVQDIQNKTDGKAAPTTPVRKQPPRKLFVFFLYSFKNYSYLSYYSYNCFIFVYYFGLILFVYCCFFFSPQLDGYAAGSNGGCGMG